jgi:thioredoxin family protein
VAMFPHERSLVERLKDKPFALVGVNSDQDREKAKKQSEEQQITWRSFYQQGTGGPISTKWNVSGWPTLYIIDHKGVIRHKWVGSPGDAVLDKSIEALVEEASKASSK